MHRSDRGIFLREAARNGASVAFVLSRTRQERRTGDTVGAPPVKGLVLAHPFGQYRRHPRGGDAVHLRYYHATVDTMLDGNHQPELDFAPCSDGTPLTPPTIEHRSEPRRRKSAETSENSKTSKT